MAADASAQVYLVLRLVLGIVFLVSALAKFRDLAAFARGVLDYQVLPHPLARAYGWLLPFVELGAALLLMSGFVPVIGAGLAVLMLVSFAVAIAINAARGRAVSCHCFGESAGGRVGWHTLLHDLTLLGPAVWLLYGAWASVPTSSIPPQHLALLGAIAVMGALMYGLIVEGMELTIGDLRMR